jgi:hypothetical protein
MKAPNSKFELFSSVFKQAGPLTDIGTGEGGRALVADQLTGELVKIGANVVRHGRYITFQLAEVAIPRDLFADILRRIDRLRPNPVLT